MHYQRWKRNGDPIVTVMTPKGEPQRFLDEVVLKFEGNECLIWPFSRPSGYATHYFRGSRKIVSRLVCEKEYGPPPTGRHEAAHSCGNGHLGCVNRKHLRWATPKENSSDKVAHGTHLKGETHPMAKLTESEVRAIRRMVQTASKTSVAKHFGICKSSVTAIVSKKLWAHVTP